MNVIFRHRTDMYFYDEDGERHNFEALEASLGEAHFWVTVEPHLMRYPEYREAMEQLASAGLARTLKETP